jgi:hypothetical protein
MCHAAIALRSMRRLIGVTPVPLQLVGGCQPHGHGGHQGFGPGPLHAGKPSLGWSWLIPQESWIHAVEQRHFWSSHMRQQHFVLDGGDATYYHVALA